MAYESAHDLPSFKQMSEQLRAMTLWGTLLLPKADRDNLDRLKAQLQFMGDTVDHFYAALGAKHWIFHEHLSLPDITAILDSSIDAEDAEQKLIAYYKDPERLERFCRLLNGFAEFRKRQQLVQRARDDYLAGRYYATTHVLLSVMDGFVNDFQTVRRRGLHAREAHEMDAWDSVVGHHQGLSNAHKTFLKSFSKTSDEPVYELYRNGIVHGTLLNYDNDVVATKAWNRLFAVMDWARATEKAATPREPEPTWTDVLVTVANTEKLKAAIAAWQPVSLVAGESGFAGHSAVATCRTYLEYWLRKNYGGMAKMTTPDTQKTYGSKLPGHIKEAYRFHALRSYEMLALRHSAAAVSEIQVKLVLDNGDEHEAWFRWIYEDEDGRGTAPGLPGQWGLIFWAPEALMERQPA